jgi:protein phosphatase
MLLFDRLREMLRRRDQRDPVRQALATPSIGKTAARSIIAPSDHLCGISDTGRRRARNEDAFHLSDEGQLLIIADGLGGHQAGDVASALAVREIAYYCSSNGQKDAVPEVESPEPVLTRALEKAHEKVVHTSQEIEREMGAAVGVAYIRGNQLFTCHVGDVRCYVWTEDSFEQITRDHSVVGALVRNGQLTPEQARRHSKKNEILQAVGIGGGIAPEVNTKVLSEGARVLLCTDGLWDALSDDEIRTTLDSDGNMRQLATLLVDRANRAGGNDNITVILYEHSANELRSED